MTAPKNKPISPEDLAFMSNYHDKHPSWGAVHVVLDDDNVDEETCQGCLEDALKKGDADGERAARIVLSLSKSQRFKLGRYPHYG